MDEHCSPASQEDTAELGEGPGGKNGDWRRARIERVSLTYGGREEVALTSEWGGQVRLLRGDHSNEELLSFAAGRENRAFQACANRGGNRMWSLENTNHSVWLARGSVWEETCA